MAYLVGIVLFAVAIIISVCLHEAGHMGAAKLFGMKVTKYFVGFGPTLWSFRRGETEYGVKAIPAGGFVKIVGMTPQDDDVAPEDEPRAMWRYPVWKRTIVMVAGSVMHFILAFVIVFGVFVFIGKPNPAAAEDRIPAYVAVQDCVITQNVQRACTATDTPSPAKQAGLQTGDKIISINGTPTPTYLDLVKAVRSAPPNTTVPVQYVRDGVTHTTKVDLGAVQRPSLDNPQGPLSTVAVLGVANDDAAAGVPPTVSVGPVEAATLSGRYMQNSTGAVLHAIGQFPEKIPKLWDALSGGQRDQNTPISVVGASRLGGESVQQGLWTWFFALLAGVNFFIGIFNLLPLLPLDGGHIAIAWFERARSWVYARLGKVDPGRVDYMKLMPITYVVILLFGGLTLLTVAADIINPVTLPR